MSYLRLYGQVRLFVDHCGFHPSQAIELTGKDGGPVEVGSTIDLSVLSLEEKQALAELLERVGISCATNSA